MGRRAHLPKVYVYFKLHRILHLLTIPQTLKICSHRPRSTTRHPRFADLSTRVLESANWNLPQPTTLGSSFPNLATTLGLRIRALPCSILQNRVPLRTHHSRSCKFERASARIGKTEPPLPPTTPGSANSSAQVLELAKPSPPAHPPPPVLQIRARKCSNWQNRLSPPLSNQPPPSVLQIRVRKCSNWQNRVPLRIHHPRSCKFERASARIGKTECPLLCPTNHSPRSCKFECASVRIGKTEPPRPPTTPGSANSSFPSTTTLGSANSSTQVLELAKPSPPAHPLPPVLQIRVRKCSNWQNRVSPPLPNQPLPSVLQIRVRKCSNWQNRASPPTYYPRFCKFERASARFGKTESPCASTTLGPANSSAQVLELAKPSPPAHPPPLVLQIRARKCSNWQYQASPPITLVLCHPPPSFRPVRARKCLNWPNRASSRSPNPPSFRKTDPLFK